MCLTVSESAILTSCRLIEEVRKLVKMFPHGLNDHPIPMVRQSSDFKKELPDSDLQ